MSKWYCYLSCSFIHSTENNPKHKKKKKKRKNWKQNSSCSNSYHSVFHTCYLTWIIAVRKSLQQLSIQWTKQYKRCWYNNKSMIQIRVWNQVKMSEIKNIWLTIKVPETTHLKKGTATHYDTMDILQQNSKIGFYNICKKLHATQS